MKEQAGHVTEADLRAWASGKFSEEEEQAFLTHTGSCDFCAELLAAYLEQDPAEPPAYLREEILEKSRSVGMQTARTIYQTSRQMRLFLYSLKVGFAVAVSLLMLFIFPKAESLDVRQKTYFPEDTHPSITERIRDGSEKVTAFLDSLTGWPVSVNYEEEQND